MSASLASAQTTNYYTDTSNAFLNANNWSLLPAGPYDQAFDGTGGGFAVFENAVTFRGGDWTVAGITVSANITLVATGGVISTYNDQPIDINVADGITADFGTQTWTSANTAAFTKSGAGTFAWAGAAFGGGFTLDAGTVVSKGDNALGGGATNFLVINGGTIASNSTGHRNFTGKFTNGISIAGDFQLGSSVGPAVGGGTMTFSNNMDLTGGVRTITLGADGIYNFGGAITNGGLILDTADAGLRPASADQRRRHQQLRG